MFSFTSVEQYHAQLADNSTSCMEAVEYYLRQIDQTRHLNHFIHVFAEEAVSRARQLDQQRNKGVKPGRLHGVVISIKDVLAYKDHPLTAASKMLQNFTSLYSATAVQRLIEEEAIIIGIVNCDEFAMGSTNENSFYGPVRNFLDENRIPGGSSGGSAVAVQARCCMISLGSDTGGSVRQPASMCGIIGFKPSYGCISRHGLIAYASSFDQVGIFANSISDIELTLDVIAGPDDFDGTVNSFKPATSGIPTDETLRFAYLPQAIDHPSLDPEMSATIKATFEKLRNKGHMVEPVDFTLLDYVVPAYYILTTAEASSNLSRYDGIRYGHRSKQETNDLAVFYERNRSEGFGKEVKQRIMLGSFVLSAGYFDAYYTSAQKVRQLISSQMKQIFNRYHFILSPVCPTTAFNIGETRQDPTEVYLADIYTVTANLAGLPAISLPLFRHSNCLPYGLQVMADRNNEVSLLRVSSTLMQEQAS